MSPAPSCYAGCTLVRVGDDPFGRGERTVWYNDPAVGGGPFYVWEKWLLPRDRKALGLAPHKPKAST